MDRLSDFGARRARRELPPAGLACTVRTAADTIDDRIQVSVDAQGVLRRGPYPWASQGRLPAAGDQGTIVPADGRAWVLVDATGPEIGASAATVDSLGERVDDVETAIDAMGDGRLIDTGGQSLGIRFGIGEWTWPGGGTDSNVTNVEHELGAVPGLILICPRNGGRGLGWQATAGNPTFSTQARADAVIGGAFASSFFWAVIG